MIFYCWTEYEGDRAGNRVFTEGQWQELLEKRERLPRSRQYVIHREPVYELDNSIEASPESMLRFARAYYDLTRQEFADRLADPREVFGEALARLEGAAAELVGEVDPPPDVSISDYHDLQQVGKAFWQWIDWAKKALPNVDSGQHDQTNGGAEASKVSLDARALGVFIEHPDWTKKRIAAHLGCHEKSLAPARCPKLNAAIAAQSAKVDPNRKFRRGHKDAEGNIEAWEDE